ncbi:T9SS C-terminal target domain-containing protein [Hymenobacter sediminis]|uniref:type IX secretion system anionic LPS delivery protein PorZ n=1 Tax=Hymenobacter sediminis TaxID=2218621 RepID=UPI000DA64307|nr:two-component regulator propeller domain-containing protein [Hymenobacter sediminis]RPD47191.1 T9SS C-terminal target domain-containing protein [Hymenobacter sediminis]
MTLPLRLRRGATLAAFFLSALAARAQSTVGYGDWQLHLPINRAKALAEVGDRVYVAAEDAFFYFDKGLNTTRLLSRRDGLHDVGVNTLAYDSVSQQVIVAYRNTNLDILRLKDGAILNLNDILSKEISGNKTINQIHVSGRMAYLACSFGIVVLDLARLEIRDTYTNIGPGGTVVQVYASAVAGNQLFAATSNGLMRVPLSSNPLDYRNWITDLPARPNNPYRTLAVQNGDVYAGIIGDQLYRYRFATPTAGWQPVASSLNGQDFRQLTPSRAGLLVVTGGGVSILNPATGTITNTLRPAQFQDPRVALRSSEGAYFLADFANGLLKTTNGQQAEQFITNAPALAQAYSILADARTNTVDVFSGGYGDRYLQRGQRLGFYEYKDGQWTNINSRTLPDPGQYPNPLDVVRGTRTPDGTLYIASYGNGVLEWKGPGEFRLFNPTTNQPNPLRSAIPNPDYTRVTDLTADAEGHIWIINRHELDGQSGVYVFDPVATNWRVLPYFDGSDNLERLVLDDAGNVWVSRARAPVGTTQGINVINPSTNANRYFGLNDGLPSGEVYDLVKDRRGDIWVATIQGPAVFNDPTSAFSPDIATGFRAPLLRRGEGAGLPTLFNEAVRTLAVDGANRKWFGTDRGLWLFNEEGDEALAHFTTANSPLPSNRIVDVEVNDKTGEVFVATDAGLVAYRGNATVTEGKASCAKVFPNPVRTDFNGQVGISGLANDGVVKITDVTGKLVYQTRANGGTVTWNLTDYNGRRVQSGVYLVLSSDADGKNGCVSKVAVVER